MLQMPHNVRNRLPVALWHHLVDQFPSLPLWIAKTKNRTTPFADACGSSSIICMRSSHYLTSLVYTALHLSLNQPATANASFKLKTTTHRSQTIVIFPMYLSITIAPLPSGLCRCSRELYCSLAVWNIPRLLFESVMTRTCNVESTTKTKTDRYKETSPYARVY